MLKNCDRILNMEVSREEVSREDLLKDFKCDVDLTTEDSPVKKPKLVNAENSDDTKRAVIVAAKWRAREIYLLLQATLFQVTAIQDMK